MRRMFCASALLCLVVVCACGGSSYTPGNTDPAQPPATDSISGTVRFKGTPLADVSITLWLTNYNKIVATATTGADGTYSFTGLSTTGNVPAEYHLWAAKSGYGFYPSVPPPTKVTRADHTGQFQGNGVTDIAIYLTVIDYTALPDSSVSNADFTAYDGSNALISLPRTGADTSYATGDDGALHAGIAWPSPRFVDNHDGTVSDGLSGLTWLRDAGCLGNAAWEEAVAAAHQLASGACGLNDGSAAGDWRMPNLNEFESLLDASASGPALPTGHPFQNVSNGLYWTSTSYFGGQTGSPNAWAIRMNDGRLINDSVSNLKIEANGTWAVKGAGQGRCAACCHGDVCDVRWRR